MRASPAPLKYVQREPGFLGPRLFASIPTVPINRQTLADNATWGAVLASIAPLCVSPARADERLQGMVAETSSEFALSVTASEATALTT